MIVAKQRHEIAVTFYPTTAHNLETCIEAAGFEIIDSDHWGIRHIDTGLVFSYPYAAIHEPRDDGYGIKFNV